MPGKETSGKDGAPRARKLAVAVDTMVLTVRDEALKVLLVRRAARHHRGEWALPGGFVGTEEPLDDAARRELLEETGLELSPTYVEQFHAYGDPGRDDRADRRVISVAYLAIQPSLPDPVAGTDAADVAWAPVEQVLDGSIPLAFDHRDIVTQAVARVREQLRYTALATAFVADEFTESELRAVYNAVWGLREAPLDVRNFHRSLHMLYPPVIDRLQSKRAGERGRPASLLSRSEWVRQSGPTTPLERPIARPTDRPGATARPDGGGAPEKPSPRKRRVN
jgi:8-oxo-dGTP diphosphatase